MSDKVVSLNPADFEGEEEESIRELADLELGLSPDEIADIVQQEVGPSVPREQLAAQASGEVNRRKLQTGCFTAPELMEATLPKREAVVDRLLYRGGAVIFAGKPKQGKSLTALSIAVDVASGNRALGCRGVGAGSVLYLALEDGPRRLRERLGKMLNGSGSPANLHFWTRLERLPSGGLQKIREWLKVHVDAVLIVVDTLERVRPRSAKTSNSLYADDYQAVTLLQSLAIEHDVAILIVHHQNKRDGEHDWLDTVSGTTGLTAGADSIWVLVKQRARADGILRVTGRDIVEQDLGLSFDQSTLRWTIAGAAEDFMRPQTRQDIIDALRQRGQPGSPQDLAKITGKNIGTVRRLMAEMDDDGELIRLDRGLYCIPPE